MNEIQARYASKIADIPCSNGVAKFERASTDNEIGHWNCDSFRGLFPTDPGDNFGGGFSDRKDGHRSFQFIEEQSTARPKLRSVGSIHPVPDLGDSQLAALSRDQHTGVEN